MNRLKKAICVIIAVSFFIGFAGKQKAEAAAAGTAAVIIAGFICALAVDIVTGEAAEDMESAIDFIDDTKDDFITGYENFGEYTVPSFNNWIGSFFEDYNTEEAEHARLAIQAAHNSFVSHHVIDTVSSGRINVPFITYRNMINEGVQFTLPSSFGNAQVWTAPTGERVVTANQTEVIDYFPDLVEMSGALRCIKGPDIVHLEVNEDNHTLNRYYVILTTYVNEDNSQQSISAYPTYFSTELTYGNGNQTYVYNFPGDVYQVGNYSDCLVYHGVNTSSYQQSMTMLNRGNIVMINTANKILSSSNYTDFKFYYLEFDSEQTLTTFFENCTLNSNTSTEQRTYTGGTDTELGKTEIEKAVDFNAAVDGVIPGENGYNPMVTFIPGEAVGEGTGTSVGVEIDGTNINSIPYSMATEDLDLNIDTPESIVNKFPFSIPFDIYYLFNILSANPQAPVFVIPMYGDDYTMTIDLSEYNQIAEIIRWFMYIAFIAGLALATNKLIGRG